MDETVHIVGERGQQRGREYVVCFCDGVPTEVQMIAPSKRTLWRRGYPMSVKAEYVVRKARALREQPA